ncbi:palmitoyltransferase ZDHHC22-like [Acanthaster planci]|uniref:Palmitoyltransferase n=1 Tax=Acanthaster planci TaxID=133434 RepID=A0A8B7YPT6_ACAPL|nr:palmitoyltransferase ZDHHC22-like [Acanthaster planci]
MGSADGLKQTDNWISRSLGTPVTTALNVIGVSYYMTVTTLGAILEWFVILPELSRALGVSAVSLQLLLLYLFVNAMGNYLLASSCDVRLKKRRRISARSANRYPMIPFRAHYCKVCDQCVLKRDHHCFVLGKCVGYHNQKYFIYCSLHTALVSVYALLTTAMYMHVSFRTKFWGAFTFFTLLPSSIERWLLGLAGLHELLLVLFLYICLTGALAGLGFFVWHMFLVVMGLTTHEAINGERGTDTSIWENFTDTLGKYWLLGVLFPVPLPQYGSGMYEGITKLPINHQD